MNSMTLDRVGTIVDATDSLSPIPAIKLKVALKKTAVNAVVALHTTAPDVERDIRDFCTSTGHEYLSVDHLDGHDVHYVQKNNVTCNTCSKVRMVVGALAAVGVLTYTAPAVIGGDPSAPMTLLFLAGVIAVPSLLINNVRILRDLIRKTTKG
ncbi:MAG TPA: sulfurtransferase TusA family protein [Magnetovibrio sp.]